VVLDIDGQAGTAGSAGPGHVPRCFRRAGPAPASIAWHAYLAHPAEHRWPTAFISTYGKMGPWEATGVLVYIVVCAAPPAARVEELVVLARRRGWSVAVVASPDAVPFVDEVALERATGYPVRTRWRLPDEPASVPDADAVVVAPATFNTLNKWVAGIADTVATGTLAEYLGRAVPIVVAPNVNADLAQHPTFRSNLRVLGEWGVTVLSDDTAPRNDRMASWSTIVEALDDEIVRRGTAERPTAAGGG
jgi:phosphopantothenoylcysteine synthetase/decarboxylase